MLKKFNNVQSVKGSLTFQGDKSISHRALLFSALADGRSKIINLSSSEDVQSTKNCLAQLGVTFVERSNSILVNGVGFCNFTEPASPLNAGNSGTTARLLAGILAAQKFSATIIGDNSLSSRPMKRIIEPLSLLGAEVQHQGYTLPLTINPSNEIHSIDYTLPVASAQVKSMILLAGLHSESFTSVKENVLTRDHTERMLRLKSIISGNVKTIYVSKSDYPEPNTYYVPGDISSASFFIVLALLTQNSEIVIEGVSLNPSRVTFIEILKNMGADIEFVEVNSFNNEPFGNLIVKSSTLTNIEIEADLIPHIIDEIPVLTIAALFAEGRFTINNAEELRKKESDRITSMVNNLRMAKISVDELPDGYSFEGLQEVYGYYKFNSYNDHRIAMAFAVLSSLLKQGSEVDNFDCFKISNPAFLYQLDSITGL